MLTVLTWLWQQPGQAPRYEAHHVNVWADMVRRHLTMPHRVACVTRTPNGIDPSIQIITPPGDFEDIQLPKWGAEMPQCLRRVSMFRPAADQIFGDRFVSMDLDCVIGGSLDPLFDRDDEFVIYRGASASRPYNGSMIMLTAGTRPQVFTELTSERAAVASARYVGSDQAWISHVLGAGEATWGSDDGVFWQTNHHRQIGASDPRLLFFPGSLKPWDMIDDPFVATHYRRSAEKRCLILGYAKTVWEEASRMKVPVDAVIASPEAAMHCEAAGWRWGRVSAISHTDEHAMKLARQMGYPAEQVMFCGRQKRSAA